MRRAFEFIVAQDGVEPDGSSLERIRLAPVRRHGLSGPSLLAESLAAEQTGDLPRGAG